MTQQKHGNVLVERKNGYVIITFNRPDKRNAFNPPIINDLSDVLGELKHDASVRAIILTGAGDSFSAGGDIKEDLDPLRRMSEPEFKRYFSEGMVMYKAIIDMPQPVIAAINGYAVGLGMEITLCCDIRIAAENAKLGEAFIRMGLTTEIGSFLLPRLIGLGRAKMVAFSGDMIEAREAERIGLVEKVVPAERLLTAAEELAAKLAQAPKSVEFIKKVMNESLSQSFDTFIDNMTDHFYKAIQTQDHAEAVTAWLEKRKPVFRGR